MGNFSIALSGLQANLVELNTIANNLANLNTTAYKEQTTSFEDLFYQQVGESGSRDPIQVGTGARVSGTNTDFVEGAILPDSSQNLAHMALNGNGFFVIEQDGVQSLTRAGNFQLNSNNQLVTANGQLVMGYSALDGFINQSSDLTPITIPAVGDLQRPESSASFNLTGNLDANANIGATFSSSIQVFDSLGQAHELTINYTKEIGRAS